MSNTISRRLDRLEQGTARGHKIFTKLDDGHYLLWLAGAPIDYRYCVNGIAPADTPPELIYTQAQLDTLERQGWNLIVVSYVQDWRPDAPQIEDPAA